MTARLPVLMAILAVGALAGCRQATTIDHIALEAQVPNALVPDHRIRHHRHRLLRKGQQVDYSTRWTRSSQAMRSALPTP